jgi:hypothetical protein
MDRIGIGRRKGRDWVWLALALMLAATPVAAAENDQDKYAPQTVAHWQTRGLSSSRTWWRISSCRTVSLAVHCNAPIRKWRRVGGSGTSSKTRRADLAACRLALLFTALARPTSRGASNERARMARTSPEESTSDEGFAASHGDRRA